MKFTFLILLFSLNVTFAQKPYKYVAGNVSVNFLHKPKVMYLGNDVTNILVRDTNLYSNFVLKYKPLANKVKSNEIRKIEKAVNDYLTEFIISMNGYIDNRTTVIEGKTNIQEIKCRFRQGNLIMSCKAWIFVDNNFIYHFSNYFAPKTDNLVLPDQDRFFKSIIIK